RAAPRPGPAAARAAVPGRARAGRRDAGLARCEALRAGLPAAAPPAVRLPVLWAHADLVSQAGRHEQALEAYAACAPLLALLGRRREQVVCANNRGYHLGMLGRRDEALAALREARETARPLGQPLLLRAYVALAHWHAAFGQLDEAESDARVAVQQARTWADAGELGGALVQLARVLARTPRTDRALLAYTEGVAALEQGGRGPAAAEARRELEALAAVPPGAR
ncbi:MAG: hypothetical protein ACKOSS_00805, partial [Planctomycetia bacterium]